MKRMIIPVILIVTFFSCSNAKQENNTVNSVKQEYIDAQSVPLNERQLLTSYWTDSPGGDLPITVDFFADHIFIIGYPGDDAHGYSRKIGSWEVVANEIFFTDLFMVTLTKTNKFNESTDRITKKEGRYLVGDLSTIAEAETIIQDGKGVPKISFNNLDPDKSSDYDSFFYAVDVDPYEKLAKVNLKKLSHLVSDPVKLLNAIYDY